MLPSARQGNQLDLQNSVNVQIQPASQNGKNLHFPNLSTFQIPQNNERSNLL